jgi:hypothetical protein
MISFYLKNHASNNNKKKHVYAKLTLKGNGFFTVEMT